MPYAKQAGALAFHDTCRQTHIVLAEDISSHGHKRYHVVRRADIGSYHGPYNELIRKDSKCRCISTWIPKCQCRIACKI